MKQNKGFVFLTVLFFLQLFSLWSIYTLLHAADILKKSDEAWRYEKETFEANQYLDRLETQVNSLMASCSIAMMPAVEIAKQPLSWWQQMACHSNFQKIAYYYVIEFLGEDTCGLIRMNENTFIANYYRITLLSQVEQQTSLLLQSTVALPGRATSPCQGKIHYVQAGRQMRREI